MLSNKITKEYKLSNIIVSFSDSSVNMFDQTEQYARGKAISKLKDPEEV